MNIKTLLVTGLVVGASINTAAATDQFQETNVVKAKGQFQILGSASAVPLTVPEMDVVRGMLVVAPPCGTTLCRELIIEQGPDLVVPPLIIRE